MNEESIHKDLIYLGRCYSALLPSTPLSIPSPPFPSPEILSLEQTQSFFVSLITEQDELASLPSVWKKLFWRRVVKGIEEGFLLRSKEENIEDEEVREEIFNELMKQIGGKGGAPGTCIKKYEWGNLLEKEKWLSVKVKEEGMIISSGTTGLRTWISSLYMCNHLIADSSLLSTNLSLTTSPILELGSGTGLLTLVLAKLSNSTVYGTDVDELVLERLKGNVNFNSLQDRINICKLDWELALSSNGFEDLLEWERSTFGVGVRPLQIFGADITYDPVLAEPLVATLRFLLRPIENILDKPEAFLTITIRIESTFERFLSVCHNNGLKVEELELKSDGENGIVGIEGWENEGEVKLIRIVKD